VAPRTVATWHSRHTSRRIRHLFVRAQALGSRRRASSILARYHNQRSDATPPVDDVAAFLRDNLTLIDMVDGQAHSLVHVIVTRPLLVPASPAMHALIYEDALRLADEITSAQQERMSTQHDEWRWGWWNRVLCEKDNSVGVVLCCIGRKVISQGRWWQQGVAGKRRPSLQCLDKLNDCCTLGTGLSHGGLPLWTAPRQGRTYHALVLQQANAVFDLTQYTCQRCRIGNEARERERERTGL
jgi:hypothetical protein